MKRGGLHVDALVSGGRNVERVRQALVTSASRRTVVSHRLADRISQDVDEPWRCTSSPSIGKACGPTTKLDIVVNGCAAATVRAIVAPLPKGLSLAIGDDVIRKSVRRIQFSPKRPAKFVCRFRQGR